MKKLLLVLFVRVPVMGTLLLINRVAEFFWIKSDKALEHLNYVLPGYERKTDDEANLGDQ